MERPDLHKFEQDLKNKPGLGSTDAPRTIKAKKLDDNNKKLTLLKGDGTYPLYEVKYTPDGTVITSIFEAESPLVGDLLYWDGSIWGVLRAPTNDALQVLTIQSGFLKWIETEDCGE